MWLNNDENWENVPVDGLYGMGIYSKDFILVKANISPDMSFHHAYTRSQVFDSDSQTTQRREWTYYLMPTNVKVSGMITAGFYLIIKKYHEVKEEGEVFAKIKEDMRKMIIVNSDDIERGEFLRDLLKAIIKASANLDEYTVAYIKEYFPDLITG